MYIFLSINFYICFGCSKEPSHRDGSFEYPQHMFWFGNKKNNFFTPFYLRLLMVGRTADSYLSCDGPASLSSSGGFFSCCVDGRCVMFDKGCDHVVT